jgi:glycosyltransferase involved in cell wall biosynthesis
VPQVTAIIPVYNGAGYVGAAVQSALGQRDVAVEVLVIDDGSTDDTWRVLGEFGDAIRKVRQENAGHVRSRNRGARLAAGDWLAFLDADDEWLPDKLAKQLALAGDEVAMVYTDRVNFGGCDRIAPVQSEGVRQYEGDVFEQLLLDNFVTVSSVIMRKDWFTQLGGFEEELLVCEDWDLWLRYSAAGGKVRLCREPLTRYRWHPGSMSNNQERMCQGRLKVLERALATPRGRQVPRRLARQARASAWQCSAWHAAATQRWRAFGWYLRSAWYRPWNLDVYKGLVKCCLGRA